MVWMHQRMQKSVQVQEGRLYVHNVVQVWWMLIRQLVHVAYDSYNYNVLIMCYLFAECNSA